MTVTRVALCSVKGCPAPSDPDWHVPHCGHGLEGEHQHWPKRSQGGKEIVAFLCHACHDKVDNRALLKNELVERNGHRYYRLYDPDRAHTAAGWALVWKEIPDEKRVQARLAVQRLPRDGSEKSQEQADGDTGVATGGLVVPELRPVSESLVFSPDFGPDYLELPAEFTLQDAVPWAAMVGKWEHGRQWYAGDLLLACEARFGHERLWGQSVSPDGKTFVDLLGMTYPSLRNCQRVCEAFSPGERYPLSFGHHAATYKHPERDRLMAQAAAEGWSVDRLRAEARGNVEPAKHDCPDCGQTHRVKEPTT